MIYDFLSGYNVVLASNSPRRQSLLKEAGIEFNIRTDVEIDESFPPTLRNEEVAMYLASKKFKAYYPGIKKNDILITADTIVCINNEIINKPADYNEAFSMIKKLSGNCHYVFTGVNIGNKEKQFSFFDCTEVYFTKLSVREIKYYVENFSPYDKAGAYGIQEWIGYVGIEKINGSYYNVMGLPLHLLYKYLKEFEF